MSQRAAGRGVRRGLGLLLLACCACPAPWDHARPPPSIPPSARTGGRRALIIGINRYALDPRTDRAPDLRGAVNDANAVHELLRTRYRFGSIRVLLDHEATRQRILREIEEHLVSAAEPGGVSLFYFAGHGSYARIPDPIDRERGGLDETLVPADANHGAPDIHDRELGALFNRALDRGVQLIALFDSCHSGGITRRVGLFSEPRLRFARPASLLPPALPPALPVGERPEDRGALLFSATQVQDPAQEIFFEGATRGLFTSSVQQVLRSVPIDEPAEQILLRTRALMQCYGARQEPSLAATAKRRAQDLLGVGPAAPDGRFLVAVSKVEQEGQQVILQGGLAIGLGRLAELRRVWPEDPLRLRVQDVLGMSSSVATVLGTGPLPRPGELFSVEKSGLPLVDSLHVFFPGDAPPAAEIEQLAAELDLLADTGRWVPDPTDPDEPAPSHVLRWQQGTYRLVDAAGREVAVLGARPAAAEVRTVLRRLQVSRIFAALPPPRELVTALRLGAGTEAPSVEVVSSPAEADYQLIVRSERRRLELAWLRPGVRRDGSELLPVRTRWVSAQHGGLPTLLAGQAQRLSRVKAWLQLPSQRTDDRFPYALKLREKATGAQPPDGAPLVVGSQYRLVLVRQPGSASRVPPARYIYVFSLDDEGRAELLYPPPTVGNAENRLPDSREGEAPPDEIPLGAGFQVTAPGSDVLILITSGSAVPNPSAVFSFEGVRQSRPVLTDPLALLFTELGDNQRAVRVLPPSDWSVTRLHLRSVPAPVPPEPGTELREEPAQRSGSRR